MSEIAIPATGTVQVHVLHEGYVGLDGDGKRVRGPVTRPRPADVTDVVFSHHQPGHTVHAALLPAAATVIVPGHGAPFRPAAHP